MRGPDVEWAWVDEVHVWARANGKRALAELIFNPGKAPYCERTPGWADDAWRTWTESRTTRRSHVSNAGTTCITGGSTQTITASPIMRKPVSVLADWARGIVLHAVLQSSMSTGDRSTEGRDP